MPLDFGQRDRPRRLPGLWLGLVPAIALIWVILALNGSGHRHLDHEQGWVGAGPACSAISAATYRARGYLGRERAVAYDQVTLARQFGHMICKDVDTRGGFGVFTHPACQFTSPTAIGVETWSGESDFELGPGRLATVSIDRGQTTCALGGRFTLFHDPTN